MGNGFGMIRRKKTAKVMKIDGSAFRLKLPVFAGEVVQNHPGFSVLDAGEVKSLGIRARPLSSGDPLLHGRLYFLVHLPRLPSQDPNPRRTLSGNLHLSAKDRLDSLLLSRRAVSDLALHHRPSSEEPPHGAMRLTMKLPKSEVARLVQESKDAHEVAHKILQLSAAIRAAQEQPSLQKRTRFMEMPAEIIA